MTTEKRIKTELIRTRVTSAEKEQFTSLCERKAINQSELLRQLIKQWIVEQLDMELERKRKTDIK